MSQDNGGKYSRRSVLQKIAAGSVVGGLAISQPVAAESPDESRLSTDTVYSSSRAQSILSALQIDHLSFAKVIKKKDKSESQLEVGIFETEIGELLYGETKSGSNSAIFKLDQGEQDSFPERYQNIPPETKPILLGKKNSTILRRETSDEEYKQILRETGFSRSEITGVAGSDIDGYYIVKEVADGESTQYHLIPDDSGYSLQNLNNSDRKDGVTTNGVVSQCGPPCTSCVAALGSCGRCVPACAGSPTGLGAILCIVCVYGSCVTAGTAGCGFCVDCLQENNYI